MRGKIHRVDDIKYMEPERTLCGLVGRLSLGENGVYYCDARKPFKAKLRTSHGVTCGSCRRLAGD